MTTVSPAVSTDRTSDNFALPNPDEIPGIGESAERRGSSANGITRAGESLYSRSSYASNSASAILMMVFQFVTDNSAIHRKVTECLMALKDDLAKVRSRSIRYE